MVLVVILLGGASQVWYAVNKVEYRWGWGRVPQYFYYLANDPVTVPFDCVVKEIKKQGKSSRITLVSADGEATTLTSATDDVEVGVGDELFEGDTIGYFAEWRTGPLLQGLWVTLWLSAASSVVALIVGLFAGLARLSENYVLRSLAGIYVEIIRGTPLLVQIYIAYYFIGRIYGLDRNVCGVLALGLFAGAYVAEIIRAGIQAIPKGQSEAARSLGMTSVQTMLDIVLPQAFKKILPPMAGQFISLIKDSSLVSIIAITDLTKAGREIVSSTFATFEVWLVVAAMYFLITSVLSQVVYYMERRYSISD